MSTKKKMKIKHVDVSFIGDTDIDQFFISKDKLKLKENEPTSSRKNNIKDTQDLLSKINLNSEEIQPIVPNDLINDKMIPEQEIFTFRTPSKKDNMILKALEAAAKRTPSSSTKTPSKTTSKNTPTKTTSKNTPSKTRSTNTPSKTTSPNKTCTPSKRTPRRCLNMNNVDTPSKRTASGTPKRMLESLQKTPQSSRLLRQVLTDNTRTPKKNNNQEIDIQLTKTPYTLRTRMKREIAKMSLYTSDSEDDFIDISASESEYSEEEDSDDNEEENESNEDETDENKEDDDSDNETPSYVPPTMPKLKLKISSDNMTSTTNRGVKRKNHLKHDLNYIPTADEYFSTNKSVTSNNTLNRLETPRFAQDKLNELLSQTENCHQQDIEGLFMEHTNLFPRWIFALKEGYNVLLHGIGSKIKLLQTFQEEYLKNHFVLVVNGFFPSLTTKQILFSLAEDLLELTTYPRDPFECLDCIEETLLDMADLSIYLIIHNLEGPMLRDSNSQEILSRLVTMENVHMLASVDHINAPLLWDQQTASRYNFTWWDVTSYQPYTSETAYESSLLVQQTGDLGLASLTTLFHSLTTNAKKIFLLIVNYQLENKTSHYAGMPFKDLYKASRQRFLVSTDMALRTQLKEYIDHQILKIKKSQEDASELLLIPMENQLLKEFLETYSKG